jgi:hypothetical protein
MREKTSPEAISRRKALSITGPELRVGFTDSYRDSRRKERNK